MRTQRAASLRALSLALVLTVATVAACDTPCEMDPNLSAEDPVDPLACPNSVWIGCTESMSCPSPGPGWTGEPLFPAPAGPGFASTLEGYCRYEYVGTDPATAEELTVDDLFAGLPTDGPGGSICPSEWLERDCNVVVPAGLVEADLLAADLSILAAQQARFEARLGVPEASGWDDLTGGTGGVRVAVLDSAEGLPVAWPVQPNADHGVFVRRLVEQVACGGQACAEVVSTQVLGGATAGEAGAFGSLSELAQGLHLAWTQWKASGSGRLVVNLSVGWAEKFTTVVDGEGVPQDRCPVAAVEVELMRLACDGALIVAAVGNRPPTLETGGPMFPAAWEVKAAPAADVCTVLLGAGAGAAGSQQLLTAVSGVNADDSFISRTPDGGRTSLVAPASQAALPVLLLDGGVGTDVAYRLPPYTGSSVATAVLSGVAASVWALEPQLTPAEVIELLGAGAATLAPPATASGSPAVVAPADLCGGKALCPKPRRVSLCGMLLQLAADGAESIPANAPILDACASGTPTPQPASVQAELAASGAVSEFNQGPSAQTSINLSELQDPLLEPYAVNPAPGRSPCGLCSAFAPATGAGVQQAAASLYFFADPAVAGMEITNAHLLVHFANADTQVVGPLDGWLPADGPSVGAGSRSLVNDIQINTAGRTITAIDLFTAVSVNGGPARAALDELPLAVLP